MINNVTDAVLVKYLLHELPENERHTVDAWLAESEANRKVCQHIQLILDQGRYIAPLPVVDEDAAWQRFTARIQDNGARRKVYPLSNVLKVAAALLLFAGGTWLAMHLPRGQVNSAVARQQPLPRQARPFQTKNDNIAKTRTIENAPTIIKSISVAHIPPPVKLAKKVTQLHKHALQVNTTDDLEKLICNSTHCPIKICITQTVNCDGGKPATVATCTTLEADQSGELCFKTLTRSCNMMVDEISIEKLSTGETIVLNAHTTPATAQDVFNYISGYKQGSITAGLFHTDCNNNGGPHGLTLENNLGNLQLQ
jgi:hypothetical protein